MASSDVDDMEVDGPVQKDNSSIQFGSSRSGDSKGKGRAAADLPVEAEDSLPWVEKYRPSTLDEVSGHAEILSTITRFVEANRLPHLLLYGPPGTGKTSTVLALARKMYGERNMRQMVLELNASDDRGIDVVREQIKTFSSTKQIFNAFPAPSAAGTGGTTGSMAKFKLIILDEADAMTATAQMALRRIMEKYTANTRFCILANYTHKLSPALQSRCTRFRFAPLPEAAIRSLVDRVIAQEHVNMAPDAVDALVRLSRGDMRRALNVLQACHASTRPLADALGESGSGAAAAAGSGSAAAAVAATAPPPKNEEIITTEHIYTCIASPHPSDIAMIRDTLLSTSDVTACLQGIGTLKTQKGLALADILAALADDLAELAVPPQTRVAWLEGLAEIEYRLAGGASEMLQLGGMVGVVRQGVELMGS